MLVLSRHADEAISCTVGDVRIEIVVVSVQGNKIRLGFTAPDEVKILRTELERPQERRDAS